MSTSHKIRRHNNSNQRKQNKNYIKNINPYGWNDIMSAIRMDNSDAALEILKNKNININCMNDSGYTPLFLAINKQNIDMVILLLEFGADVNIKLSSGTSCLHEAARLHNLKLINILLEHKANPCAVDVFNRYPSSNKKFINVNKKLKDARFKWKINHVLCSKLFIVHLNIPKEVVFIILTYLQS